MSSSNYFQLENELKQTVRMDAPLTKGPAPKWERQGMNRSASSTSSLANTNGSFVGMNASRSTTTKTPGKGKTPGSAAKKKPTGLTPGNDVGKRTAFADRFIPSRATTHFDIGQHSHLQAQDPDAASGDSSGGDSTAHKRMLEEELGVGKEREVIFSYSVKPAPAPADHVNSLKVVYTQGSLPPSVQKTAGRFISTKPDRILDAPALMDDFYLHPIDWSRNNHVAVALTDSVYVWNAGTSEIHHLANMCADDNDDNTATSVSWIEAGTHLAIGTSDGEVWLYDVAASRRVRRMRGHTSRVPCLAWNEYIISSGSATGAIYHYDVRVAEFKVSGCPQAHSGLEVCGLSWSPDQRYLASGGNDNAVKIWVPGDNGSRSVPDGSEPVHTFTHHQAAVKALAWCPWKPNVLASGGGTNDRHIRLWNVASGALLKELDTQSQVSALAWSEEYHEIVSAHGHASNQVVIWRFPGMEKVARLEGHEARVLDMSMSPDRTTIVTAGADETLRIWKCFAVDEERKKAKLRREAQAKGGRSAFQTLMR